MQLAWLAHRSHHACCIIHAPVWWWLVGAMLVSELFVAHACRSLCVLFMLQMLQPVLNERRMGSLPGILDFDRGVVALLFLLKLKIKKDSA
jgi:hypothetical protein